MLIKWFEERYRIGHVDRNWEIRGTCGLPKRIESRIIYRHQLAFFIFDEKTQIFPNLNSCRSSSGRVAHFLCNNLSEVRLTNAALRRSRCIKVVT